MITKSCVFSFLMALTSLPLLAAPQESLGDFARQVRQEQAKAGPKTAKVYTNDNLPDRRPDRGRAAVSDASSTPTATASEQAQAESNARQAVKQANQASEPSQPASKSEKPEDKAETKEYWQARFKSVRAQLADAQKRQELVEDEINLLQIQEGRALDPNLKTEFAGKIKDKGDELSQKRTATEQARKALEDLQREFQASGAPEEWSQESEASSE
jgi:hypothetical protein